MYFGAEFWRHRGLMVWCNSLDWTEFHNLHGNAIMCYILYDLTVNFLCAFEQLCMIYLLLAAVVAHWISNEFALTVSIKFIRRSKKITSGFPFKLIPNEEKKIVVFILRLLRIFFFAWYSRSKDFAATLPIKTKSHMQNTHQLNSCDSLSVSESSFVCTKLD